MKKILVLVAFYPDDAGGVALMYVHVRNKYYMQHGIDVTVLNFSADHDYEIDGIPVITLQTYVKNHSDYDTLVLHAANLRNHYRFLKKYELRFPHMVFFYHGHEVLRINETYPEPYEYTKKASVFRKKFQDVYDTVKLAIWRRYLPTVANKSDFIFVSNWFYHEFERYVRLSEKDLGNHVHIINNSVGEIFEKNSYEPVELYREADGGKGDDGQPVYDFITIRNNMDNSKYGIDLVDGLARKYPQYTFLIVGKGVFYKVHDVPKNVTWLETALSHKDMLGYLNHARCGLLLTREDTQGVMTCEMAVYGIPVITSDIEVCREICRELDNVELVENDVEKIDLPKIYEKLTGMRLSSKPVNYSYSNTVAKEEVLINTGGGMTS